MSVFGLLYCLISIFLLISSFRNLLFVIILIFLWGSAENVLINRTFLKKFEKITGNYETTVGQDAFGKVYAGTLEDRTTATAR